MCLRYGAPRGPVSKFAHEEILTLKDYSDDGMEKWGKWTKRKEYKVIKECHFKNFIQPFTYNDDGDDQIDGYGFALE